MIRQGTMVVVVLLLASCQSYLGGSSGSFSHCVVDGYLQENAGHEALHRLKQGYLQAGFKVSERDVATNKTALVVVGQAMDADVVLDWTDSSIDYSYDTRIRRHSQVLPLEIHAFHGVLDRERKEK